MLADTSSQFPSTLLLLDLPQTVLQVWTALPSFSSSKCLHKLHNLPTHLVKYLVIFSLNEIFWKSKIAFKYCTYYKYIRKNKQILSVKKHMQRLCLKHHQSGTSLDWLNSMLKETQIPIIKNNVKRYEFQVPHLLVKVCQTLWV